MKRKSHAGKNAAPPLFSVHLQGWLKSKGGKTLGGLNQVFAEKTFAIAFLLLMALPALPLPTGGITHVTELITMLLCLEMIAGRKSPWLPKRWLKVDVAGPLSGKAGKRFIGFVEWFERRSRRRWGIVISRTPVLSFIGLIIFIYTVAAFAAPPFSGLDTLPALGVVIMSLGLILDDGLMLAVGVVMGTVGIGVEIAAGTALYDGLKHFAGYV